MAGGRPTKYNKEIAEQICLITATTTCSLLSISHRADVNTPIRTIYDWLDKYEEFSHMYARAKEHQADLLVEQMLEIADDNSRDDTEFTGANHVNRAKLQVDTRKWIAAKLKPRRYSEKVEHIGTVSNLNYNVEITADEAKTISKALDNEY